MKEKRYTPGPWEAKGPDHVKGISSFEIRREGKQVGYVGMFSKVIPSSLSGPAWELAQEDLKANARLISAAPEMAEAALSLFNRHTAHARAANFDNCGCDDCVAFRPALQKAGLL